MHGLNSYRDELCDCSSATPFRGSQQQSSFPDEHGIESFGSANVMKGSHQESRVHDSQAKVFQEVATRFFHDEPSKQINRDGTHLNCAEASLPVPGPGGGKRCGIQPMISKKLAANVAFLGAILMCSVRSMFTMMSDHTDFMEVACSPTSGLSSCMQDLGYSIQRVNYREGFDLDRKVGTTKLRHRIAQSPPEHCWISLKCTRLSNLNHLTRRTDAEEAAFQKRQSNDLQRAYEVSLALEPVLSTGGDVSWEWPTGASAGWRSKAISNLKGLAAKYNRQLYMCHFHGCAYGLVWQGHPVMKGWTVATTSRHVWLALQKRCPGHEDHVHCRGQVAVASSYYPKAMVEAVTKAISCQRCIHSFAASRE